MIDGWAFGKADQLVEKLVEKPTIALGGASAALFPRQKLLDRLGLCLRKLLWGSEILTIESH